MAQYFTDFSGYTSGAAPSDWTRVFVLTGNNFTVEDVAAATGGKVLRRLGGGAAARKGIRWDLITSDADRANVEIVFRFRATALGSLFMRFFAAARMAGGAGTETTLNVGWDGGVNGTLGRRIVRYLAGALASIASDGAGSPALVTDTWYWTRARFDGTTINGKVWADGATEPASWDVTGTDTDITAAGWVGLFTFGVESYEVDVYGVGTAGDVAPVAPPTASSVLSASPSASGTITAGLSGVAAPTEMAAPLTATGNVNAELVLSQIRRMRVELHNGEEPVAAQTGVLMHWWDAATPTGAPALSTATGVIDASGAAELVLEGTTSLAVAAHGYVLITKIDASDHRDSLVFAGRQTVQLI